MLALPSIDELGDELVDSPRRELPLVAIVVFGGGVLGYSLNYDEIANVPQVHAQAKGAYFSWGAAGLYFS
jgi:hypothetical protein